MRLSLIIIGLILLFVVASENTDLIRLAAFVSSLTSFYFAFPPYKRKEVLSAFKSDFRTF